MAANTVSNSMLNARAELVLERHFRMVSGVPTGTSAISMTSLPPPPPAPLQGAASALSNVLTTQALAAFDTLFPSPPTSPSHLCSCGSDGSSDGSSLSSSVSTPRSALTQALRQAGLASQHHKVTRTWAPCSMRQS